MYRTAWTTALIGAAGLSTPAVAALPEPVKAMIDAAIASGNKQDVLAIVKIAKTTNPDDVAEIDSMLADYNHNQAKLAEAALREKQEAGFFENKSVTCPGWP